MAFSLKIEAENIAESITTKKKITEKISKSVNQTANIVRYASLLTSIKNQKKKKVQIKSKQ